MVAMATKMIKDIRMSSVVNFYFNYVSNFDKVGVRN